MLGIKSNERFHSKNLTSTAIERLRGKCEEIERWRKFSELTRKMKFILFPSRKSLCWTILMQLIKGLLLMALSNI